MASPIVDDYYALLGVSAGVGTEELRAAWRGLAARWHPDRAGAAATGMFQRLSAAYTVLSDPVARAAYDRRRRAAGVVDAPRPAGGAAVAPRRAPGRGAAPGVMLSRLSGSLSVLVARGAAGVDEPGFVTLMLGEAEAARGGMVMVSMHVDLWCPKCGGGRERSAGCARCGGRRTVEELFSAWLAVRPGAFDGEVLTPSAELPGTVEPVRFRVRVGAGG